jgi:uncharacterized protein
MVSTPEIQEHSIRSRHVAQVFRIKVLLPPAAAHESEKYPVLYATDSDEYFGGLATLAASLQLLGDTQRFILVGIGYGDLRAARLLRWRDLKSHQVRAHYRELLEQLWKSPLVAGVSDLREITDTTDAADFLTFIRGELIPFIDSTYNTLRGDHNFSGYSAGGGFGLYSLFTQPETFRRYILGSPGVSHAGHHYGVELARAFIQTQKPVSAKVFMSVGELEEFERGFEKLDLVSGYYELAKFLRASAVNGLELTCRLFPGESHATAWAPSFSHGLKLLFPPPADAPDWRRFFR